MTEMAPEERADNALVKAGLRPNAERRSLIATQIRQAEKAAVQAEREEIASMAEMALKDPQEARAFAARIRARREEKNG